MGFQVLFKGKGFGAVFERNIGDQIPRLVFGGMRGLAVVVGRKAGFNIFRKTDVCLIRIGDAAEEIDVIYVCISVLPVFNSNNAWLLLRIQLRRTGYHA